jgi:hypothetical protein
MVIYNLRSYIVLAVTISNGILSPTSEYSSVFGILENDVDEKTSMYIDIKRVDNLGVWIYS